MLRYLIGAIAVLALWGIFHFTSDPVSGFARQHKDAIVEALNEDLGRSNPACVYDISFPRNLKIEASRGHRGQNSVAELAAFQFRCRYCEELIEAGLIKRYVTEMPRDSSGSMVYRYDLTASGLTVYTEEREPLSGQRSPRFCFGTARVDEIVAALDEISIGTAFAVSVKYTVKILDPSSFLFTPESAKLGLPTLSQGATSLPKPRRTTLVFSPDGTVNYIEAGIRYGKWAYEK